MQEVAGQQEKRKYVVWLSLQDTSSLCLFWRHIFHWAAEIVLMLAYNCTNTDLSYNLYNLGLLSFLSLKKTYIFVLGFFWLKNIQALFKHIKLVGKIKKDMGFNTWPWNVMIVLISVIDLQTIWKHIVWPGIDLEPGCRNYC